jgi:hypothetical protein
MTPELSLAERVAVALEAVREPLPEPPASRLPLPVYYHERFRCKGCGSAQFDSNRMRSRRQPSGESRQVKTCAECGWQCVLVVK